MGEALDEKAAAAEAATALAAEMKAVVQQSLLEKGEAVERAEAEAKAAGAAKSAAEQEKARAAQEVKAAKMEVCMYGRYLLPGKRVCHLEICSPCNPRNVQSSSYAVVPRPVLRCVRESLWCHVFCPCVALVCALLLV